MRNSSSQGIVIRPSSDRGSADFGWLKSFHTFSFGEYHDRRHMSFRALRVINEDFIAGGGGFPSHPHRDMEIITVVIDGELQHKDSMGNGSVIRRGDVQKMSAGTGVVHSEFNASPENPVHLLQIWILPDQKNLTPEYQQIAYAPDALGLTLVAAPAQTANVISIHQDVFLYRGLLDKGASKRMQLAQGRGMWVQVIKGSLDINGIVLNPGDGASTEIAAEYHLKALSSAEFLLFDLGSSK